MSKSLRLSEKWFHRGLWVVALVFAGFLIGLGNTIVGDLPRIEEPLQLERFMDQNAARPLWDTIERAAADGRTADRELAQAQLALEVAGKANQNSREAFSNWIATRSATSRPDQDPEVISRTRALDVLKAQEQQAQLRLDRQRQVALDAQQAAEQAQSRLDLLSVDAQHRLDAEQRRVELRVFGYRLALTLPLLVIAGWLFSRQRKSRWWPFVWGFILFALFAFFVELVPYLPSYGGYVRYAVGIVVTVLVGRWAILGLSRYLERQKLAEQQPERERREELGYDVALARLDKGVCPGCERRVDLKDPVNDFCPHCGIGLFDHCAKCTARKSAFAHYCHACGTAPPAPTAA